MFALLISDDRISMQDRRREIIQGLRVLPGESGPLLSTVLSLQRRLQGTEIENCLVVSVGFPGG